MTTSDIENKVQEVGDKLKLDVESITATCDAVLAKKLYWFPVRHHSPMVARQLQAVITKRKPKMIFLEAPHQANHLLQHIVDRNTKPPVAIYSSYRDDDDVLGLAGIFSSAKNVPLRSASWYPIMSYSPEYVTMMTAQTVGAKIMMMDLPHYALLKPLAQLAGPGGSEDDDGADDAADDEEEEEDDDHDHDDDDEPETEDSSSDTEDSANGTDSDADSEEKDKDTIKDSGPNGSADDKSGETAINDPLSEKHKGESPKPQIGTERLITESSFYRALAQVGGYRTFNECWDSLFEVREFESIEFFRRELAMFCAASRATASVKGISKDGTLERERHMLQTIAQVMETENLAPEECMVVCGGFHLFLDADDTTPPPTPPAGTVYNTLVPYSYFRVSELSGYGAGNRAPRYYQTMWELHQKQKDEDLLIEHVVDIIKEARKSGEPVSSADAISTCQHANMLARLRGRPTPILDDIHDAILTCCCKGDPKDVGLHLLKAIDHCDIGTKIGRVTEAVGQLPIISDFYKQLNDLELDEAIQKEKRVSMTLDRRIDQADRQSQFLHRTVFLGVSLATQTEAPSGDFASGMLFQERWALKWSPTVEANLIEKNLYGDTIESAALAFLREKLTKEESHAGKLSSMLASAANMNLPNLIVEVEDALAHAIDNDSRFVSLTQALSNLVIIERYAIYRNTRRGTLDDLILRCFDRSCFSILDVVSVPEAEQPNVVTGLLTIAEMLQRGDRPELDRNLFIEHVRHAANVTPVPFLRGVFLGVLTEMRMITADDLAQEISALAKAPKDIMVSAGDFLDGVIATSRASIMLGAKSLVEAVDELLRVAEWEAFLTMLPRMRAAFERLHERQVESFAATVAQRYGLEEGAMLTELRTSIGAAAVIARIDNRVAEIMEKWEF